MTAQKIPVTNTPLNYKMSIALDGTVYTLVFYFNDRTNTWTMDLQDVNGIPLVDNIVLVPKYPLNYRSVAGRVPGAPPGIFFLLDESGQDRTPDNTNLGNGINLYYEPVSTIPAAG
jgi:hypothetical protein